MVSAGTVLGAFWTPCDSERMDLSRQVSPPSFGHLLGTDEFGRDVLSRILRGARATMLVGIGAVLIAGLAGVALGALGSSGRRLVSGPVMAFVDGLYAFPSLITALALIAVLGPGAGQISLAIGVAEAPAFARLTRSVILSLLGQPFIEGARAIGATRARILCRYLLPNAAPFLLVQAGITLSTAILAEASLSFLGLGVQPPSPSWGYMLQSAQNLLSVAPWLAVAPGLCIVLTILGINLTADGLAEWSDPRRK